MGLDLAVLIPVYNDWPSLHTLIRDLDNRLLPTGHTVQLVLVDDGSSECDVFDNDQYIRSPFLTQRTLRLRYNMGHQKAIAIGLCWVCTHLNVDAVVVMDGDGEDRPDDVIRLAAEFEKTGRTVFAERTQRSEGVFFRSFYLLFRAMHRALIGKSVRMGNFSIIGMADLRRLCVSPYLWHNYAAALIRTRIPFVTVQTTRGFRYCGQSKMNFVSLVRHGLGAIAVHSETTSVRLLIGCAIAVIMAVALELCVVMIRMFTPLAIPGWATYVSGLLLIVLLQVLTFTFLFATQSISMQSNVAHSPVRDVSALIEHVKNDWETFADVTSA